MSNWNTKIGTKEVVVRHDGKFNVWEYVKDQTVNLSVEDQEWCDKNGIVPARWIVTEVRDHE